LLRSTAVIKIDFHKKTPCKHIWSKLTQGAKGISICTIIERGDVQIEIYEKTMNTKSTINFGRTLQKLIIWLLCNITN
jgi:hypothetical protein